MDRPHCDRCDAVTDGTKGVHVRDLGALQADPQNWTPQARLVIKVEIQDEEGHWRPGTADMCEKCMFEIMFTEFPSILALGWGKSTTGYIPPSK